MQVFPLVIKCDQTHRVDVINIIALFYHIKQVDSIVNVGLE